METIKITFEKIGHNGVSIGKFENKIVFAYGILPGEEALVKVIKNKKNFIEAEVLEILNKSPYRVEAKENHYLSCSPWQTFSYDWQVKIKKDLLKEIYLKFANIEIELKNFNRAKEIFGYRTKIEYSFLEENEKNWFAFYKRGSFKEKIKLENGCLLMDEQANYLALEVLKEINKKRLKNLKSLIIRKAKRTSDIHISVLTKDKDQSFVYKNDKLSGFVFAFSNPKSPASRFDKVLNSWGREYLKEKILNLEILYPYNSFFQNNIELFEEALRVMIENSEDFKKVVDLYSGVGVIGLSLKEKAKEILAVDIDKSSISYAKLNAEINGINNFKALVLPSEKISSELLEKVDLLILDPPRAGLHKKLIDLILKTKPENIFYLSCNPITQARDFNFLKNEYKIKGVYGFDFYPNTPHLECLLILKRK
ncbi:23S rRNA (uracil-C(5))-methyltransferase RlmCD [bacterium HR35]|nr:23S rRNA (uracil-C(5))-methyltransferase RlmCD [bacterium HR35]